MSGDLLAAKNAKSAKAGWKKVRLGELITDIAAGPFGSNLKISCFVPSGFPIIDGANL